MRDQFADALFLVEAHLDALFPRGDLRVLRTEVLVELLRPVFARLAAVGVLVVYAQALRKFRAHLVDATALELLFVHRLAVDDGLQVVVVRSANQAQLLLAGQVRQKDVSVLARVGHEDVAAHDELALRFVNQHVVRVVDVGMLVGQSVAGIVEQELDAALQLLGLHDAGVQVRHGFRRLDGLVPQEERNLRAHRVFARGEAAHGETDLVFAAAVVHARLANLAKQLRQNHDGTARCLAVGVALRAVTLGDEHGVRLVHFASKVLDALFGNQRDLRSPCRGLRRHVVASAQDVVFVRGVLALCGLRQRLLVIADAILVQELFVSPTVVDDLIRQSCAQRGVGARANRNPLGVVASCRVVQARVDVDDAQVVFFASVHQVVALTGAAHAGFNGARAEHDHKLVVLQRLIVATVAARFAIRIERRTHQLTVAVRTIVGKVAARKVQQTADRAGTPNAHGHARGVLQVHGLVAVLFANTLHLACDGVESLVPRDALELAFTALCTLRAFHGVVQALGALQPAASRAAAQASAHLRIGEIAGARVVGLDELDFPVLDVALPHAAATAVHGAMRVDDLLLGFCVRRFSGVEQVCARCSSAADSCQSTQRTSRLDERATVHAWHVLHCLPLRFVSRLAETASCCSRRFLPRAAFSSCAPRPSSAGFVIPLSADLMGKPYRATYAVVSHKTCEFCVYPVQKLSHASTCDTMRLAGRYTVQGRLLLRAHAAQRLRTTRRDRRKRQGGRRPHRIDAPS